MFLSARRRFRPMRTAFAAILSALVVTAALGITVSAADPNPCEPKPCLLRFANQPKTTETDGTIRDGFNSSGGAIRVEIYDAKTGVTVNSTAAVTLTLGFPAVAGWRAQRRRAGQRGGRRRHVRRPVDRCSWGIQAEGQ